MFRSYWEVLGGFRRKAGWCVVLLVGSGLAEAFGIASLLPLLSGKLSPEAGGRSEWFGLSGTTLTLAALGALVGLGTLAALLRYVSESRMYAVEYSLERSLRSRMVTALLRMRWTAYTGTQLGAGVKSVLVETAQIGSGARAFMQAVGNAAIAAAFVAVGLVVSPVMTAAVMFFGGLTALVYRRVGRRSQALGRELSGQAGALSESATDLLTNAKFYRSTGLQDRMLARIDTLFGRWSRYSIRMRRHLPQTRLTTDLAGLFFIGGALTITFVVLGGSLAGPLVFLALFYRLVPRLQQAQQSLLQARGHVSWWHTWKEQYQAATSAADVPTGRVQLTAAPTVEFDAVSLVFPGRSVPALSDVSCALAPGECVAVVGESGGGKTTLLDLVTGLLRPSAGAIRLDGIELAEVDLQAWRDRIGLVMQDSPVFDASLLENIAWGDAEADEERARRVAEMAHLTEVIRALPDGLHTQVGQKGGRFSGGQRQRLALARALYREPWLLILDEATNALDSESETMVQQTLASLRGSCSVLMVAHRLKTVEIADRILVLSQGKVVQTGTWDELLASDGWFARHAAAQGIPSGRVVAL